jgi:hypothetical protein
MSTFRVGFTLALGMALGYLVPHLLWSWTVSTLLDRELKDSGAYDHLVWKDLRPPTLHSDIGRGRD